MILCIPFFGILKYTSAQRIGEGRSFMGNFGMLFVFFFLTVVLALQLLLKTPKKKNVALLVCSLVFYAWNGIGQLLLLLCMTAIAWFGGLLIQVAQNDKQKKGFLIGSLVLILAGVFFFGYRQFFAAITHRLIQLPKAVPQVIVPLGMAYYSLGLISYLVDVYRGDIKAQTKYWLILCYASLFPVGVGGPVVRYQEVRRFLFRRKTNLGGISRGISRFTVGLAKATVLAASLSDLASSILVEDTALLALIPAVSFWIGLLAYGLCVYLYLSAYADMAIGIGLMLGFVFPEQFNYPFIATSISDFWSRWQMTTVAFFRDYVHDPLGNGTGKLEVLILIGVWVLLGVWMGPKIGLVLWAVFFLVLLLLEQVVLKNGLEKLPINLRRVLTLLLVYLSFVLLWCQDISVLPTVLKGMLGLSPGGIVSTASVLTLVNNLPILILGVIAVTPLGSVLRNNLEEKAETSTVAMVLASLWEGLHPVLLLILSAMAMTGLTTNPFLFFQI